MMNTPGNISLIQCGRHLNPQEIEQIQETVNLFPKLSRTELAQTICEHLKWFTASGSSKEQACLKLLKKLEKSGFIKLPPTTIKNRKFKRAIDFTARTQKRPNIVGNLSILGKVSLEVVQDKESEKLWKEYMARYHYLGNTRPFGFYLRYFFRSQSEILGCALFSGAAKSLGVRDDWIGWTKNQRLRNLSWLINNSRFLIFPWVQVKYLASHILGQVSRQIGKDWYERWGYYPVLMETFVDGNYYSGTSYKAANWKHLGMTTGEGLVRKGKTYTTNPKMIFVKPLTKKFRDILCSGELVGRSEI
ncbi:MAG: DUF4338 domain-containing protein [Desulfobacterales bacterium]|nr:DUF4338 domain-containing protein [Desulfobacterales bacterium]